jgi:phosphate transport system substrate-binding protein
VFAVPLGNPRGNIRGTEVVDIYAEKIKTWGDGTPIRFVLRPPSDTDTDLLVRFLPMLEVPLKRAAESRIVPVAYTDQEAADLVETMPGGFGPNTLSLILAEKRPLKVLALDGVSPTIDTIRNGTYDLAKVLYIVTRRDSGAAVQAFVDFALSPPGRVILEGVGIAPPRDGT